MKRSTQRILTTHVGSLPRPPDLLQMIEAKERGEPLDTEAYARRVASAVAEVVRKQAESGVDIVADGEMGRFGFIPYVNERLAGIEPRKSAGRGSNWAQSREYLAFPEYYQWASQMPGAAGRNPPTQWVCTGPIAYRGRDALQRDINNLKGALAEVTCEEAFMPAVSPANLANWNTNEYYKSDEEFRIAIADALHEEYQAIVDAGLVLQVDDPQLASHWAMHPEIDLAECRRWASASVELLNHALRGIPAERVRYHTCYSINMGPRVHDMELKHIVDIMLQVRAGAYSFEAANPRHEHEWRVWETVKAARRQGIDPRNRHPCLQSGRASRDRCPAHCALCRRRRARKRDRRRRLRFRQLLDIVRGPSERRLGQIGGFGARRAPGDGRVMGPCLTDRRDPSKDRRRIGPVMRCARCECRQPGGHEILRAMRRTAGFHLPVLRRCQPSRTQILWAMRHLARPAGVSGVGRPDALCGKGPGPPGTVNTLPGEIKQVTVLFCDIVNSTPLTERLGAEGMRDLVHAFLEASLAEVHRYGGTAPQFTGDGFMALFGAPLTQEDHVRRALLAAVAIERALHDGGAAADPELFELTVRIGIHTGPVVFGPVADNLAMDYTVIGDTANVAARLQQAAEPGTILLSEATYLLAQDYARVEPVGPLILKGKAEPIPAYRLLGVSHRRSGLRESTIAGDGGFCRSRERTRDPQQFSSAGRKRAWPSRWPRR